MNRSTQMSEAARWWVPMGLAGATGATCVAMMFGSILSSAASPAWPPEDTGAGTPAVTQPTDETAPCFIQPLSWNAALDGPIPLCAETPEQTVPFSLDVRSNEHAAPRGDDDANDVRCFIGQVRRQADALAECF